MMSRIGNHTAFPNYTSKNKLNKTPAESVVCATPATKAVQTSIETLFARGLPTEPQA